MNYIKLQDRLHALLVRRSNVPSSGQTPGGTPTMPDARRPDAPGETLVAGGDELVDTAAPGHVAQLINAAAIMHEQRERLAAIRALVKDYEDDIEMMMGITPGQAAMDTLASIRGVLG